MHIDEHYILTIYIYIYIQLVLSPDLDAYRVVSCTPQPAVTAEHSRAVSMTVLIWTTVVVLL